MKVFWKEFFHRGMLAAWGGPVILAIIYGVSGMDSLSSGQVCLGILTITLLAFVVAGSGAVYQIEKLPLGTAIAIHGAILYASYILIYLVNGWLKKQLLPILVFTLIFIIGYAIILCLIFFTTKAKTKKLNKMLKG